MKLLVISCYLLLYYPRSSTRLRLEWVWSSIISNSIMWLGVPSRIPAEETTCQILGKKLPSGLNFKRNSFVWRSALTGGIGQVELLNNVMVTYHYNYKDPEIPWNGQILLYLGQVFQSGLLEPKQAKNGPDQKLGSMSSLAVRGPSRLGQEHSSSAQIVLGCQNFGLGLGILSFCYLQFILGLDHVVQIDYWNRLYLD